MDDFDEDDFEDEDDLDDDEDRDDDDEEEEDDDEVRKPAFVSSINSIANKLP